MRALLARLTPSFVTIVLVAALIVFAGSHSWSDSLTTWALVGILAGATVVNFWMTKREERSIRGQTRHQPKPRT